MFRSVLTLCVGNICRSPVAEKLLLELLPDHDISSAGLGALVGYDIDQEARAAAAAAGYVFDLHRARQFTAEIGRRADLILVMERRHLDDLKRQSPQLAGRAMLMTHWDGGSDITDPYLRGADAHQRAFRQIELGATSWARRLAPKKSSERRDK